ncbi:tryptophan 7-halogenase [Hyphomonas sp.]|uniref:tryptophan 7-halogenase n=1 Tax=Hyphomonas sp. TaxID=87 RepID=UPI00391C6C16
MAALRRIAVLGSGLGAWMAAAYLARSLKRLGTEIVQVPAGDPAPPPPALAALPSLESLHLSLGFDPGDLIRAAGASFRMGTLVSGTGGVIAYGDTGAPFGPVAFHLAWRAFTGDPSPAAYADHSLAALAARAGKFAPPLPGGPPGSSFSPGLHLSGPAYLSYLQRAALHYGAIPAAALVPGSVDGEAGTLRLSDGAHLSADLILDTGGHAAPAETAPFPALPAQITLRHGRRAEAALLGRASLHTVSGTLAVDIPLHGETFRTLLSTSDATAHRASSMLRREGFELLQGGGATFTPARAHTPWEGRLIRLGDAACRLPPVEAFDLRILQAGLETLLALLPGGHPDLPERAEYNRLMADTFTSLADYAALAFLTPGPLAETLPASLRLRLENFTSRGRIFLSDGESFTRESWASAFIAHGWQMRRADAHAAALPEARVINSLAAMRSALAATAETLPDQRTYLRHAGLIAPSRAGAG